MKVSLWGTRGSLPCPGPDWARYGGNTSCVAVEGRDRAALVVLDAGTGAVRLGHRIPTDVKRVDLLLSHLHMDHILGLGFFAPLFDAGMEVHLWGPASTTMDLRTRLTRYLSPPLFPVRLRDLPCRLEVHDIPIGRFELPSMVVDADLVCHPGSSAGYRLSDGEVAVAYLPDHEPALGVADFPSAPEWTSGHELAAGADLLIHDAQFAAAEYAERVGWGHSSIDDAEAFASHAGVGRLVAFHHDPSHDDAWLDHCYGTAPSADLVVTPAREGDRFVL